MNNFEKTTITIYDEGPFALHICIAENSDVVLPDKLHACHSQNNYTSVFICATSTTKLTGTHAVICDNRSHDSTQACLAMSKLRTHVEGSSPVYTQGTSVHFFSPILRIHVTFTNCRRVDHNKYVLCDVLRQSTWDCIGRLVKHYGRSALLVVAYQRCQQGVVALVGILVVNIKYTCKLHLGISELGKLGEKWKINGRTWRNTMNKVTPRVKLC